MARPLAAAANARRRGFPPPNGWMEAEKPRRRASDDRRGGPGGRALGARDPWLGSPAGWRGWAGARALAPFSVCGAWADGSPERRHRRGHHGSASACELPCAEHNGCFPSAASFPNRRSQRVDVALPTRSGVFAVVYEEPSRRFTEVGRHRAGELHALGVAERAARLATAGAIEAVSLIHKAINHGWGPTPAEYNK